MSATLRRTIFRDVRSHPVELKRCPSDPSRICPNVRSFGKYFLRTDIRGEKEGNFADFKRQMDEASPGYERDMVEHLHVSLPRNAVVARTC